MPTEIERHASTGFLHPELSHVMGATSSALWDITIPALFKRTEAEYASRDAAVFLEQGVRLTWSQLSEHVDALAGGLLSLGLTKGDRLGIWSPNRVEWLLTQLATARLGVILVTINPAYRAAELEYAINKVGCNALIMARQFKSSNYPEILSGLAPDLERKDGKSHRLERMPSLEHVVLMGSSKRAGMLSFDELVERGRPASKHELDMISGGLSSHDAINIQFTSGTTGSPKGATLSHFNIVNNSRFVGEGYGLISSDRLCIPVPLYHVFGMVIGVLACVATGAAMIFPSSGFDAESVLHAVHRERCTGLYGVPTMFAAELNHPNFGNYDLSSLTKGIMTGAPCPAPLMQRVMTEMNMTEVSIIFGMTETSPVSFQTSIRDGIDIRIGSVGRIHQHVECKVVDASGDTVQRGIEGEACVRGYSVMKGYWNDEALTSATIDADGWLRTGDLVTIDAEGVCRITGRSKDMLIRGGENISPREIEDVLHRHPSVQEAQVFGIPDPHFGEEVCAWVVVRAGSPASADELQQFCRQRIAHFKVPRYLRIVSELPMTVSGKPQKFVMREIMVRDLGLASA